jgi:hypothetical protein
MAVSRKDKRGPVEELRTLRTRLDRLESGNAELIQVQETLQESVEQFKMIFDDPLVGVAGVANRKGGYDEQRAFFLETFISTCAGGPGKNRPGRVDAAVRIGYPNQRLASDARNLNDSSD